MTDAKLAHELLSDMVRVRRMEEKCAELYSAAKIRGFLHLYVGEEAVAAGSLRALNDDDAVVATYREHAHALLRGIPMTSIMAEMYGKQEGCSRGRGGSMHLFDASKRFYGGNAIVAGGLPLAVGIALADAMLQRRRVTACYFGDGAVAEGAFHESLNMAVLWQLPVLFCCENNLYAMGTALDRAQSQTDLTLKAAAYRVPTLAVDGMDVQACHAAAEQGAEHVRTTGGPFFLEFRTYRFRAHSMFDPELYRDKAEVERWRERDPIQSFIEQCLLDGTISEDDVGGIEDAAAEEIQSAVAYAEAGTWEDTDDLERDVMTPSSHDEWNTLEEPTPEPAR
ncbi:pyruvate dehydrogenase (acetyl-transferring) E1 component subunit alpha [Mycobacterium szulgai]|uniref:Pyruvate dehydrogenase E1 component subunit alpha n=1 Tax=Mycobacterium szulgai TaxID=1787 RepID=A0A1X2DQR9_MYCSZ|nr:pyruvate dehydrogenase (acetyl-transferring) E1 component subunit alpha [Mycobacterium szulgai]MCV7075501.1 pyruvate dehydrogenase (acetyl-transferring) E1 component subunit alpha [Mycobacterium szulgai]ORW90390.1 pyruvate dehydrogenase (acetyl-transferring) E1 component subunit alpha [Mycobacterium szulgai]